MMFSIPMAYDELFEHVKELRPDLVITDAPMSDGTLVEYAPALRSTIYSVLQELADTRKIQRREGGWRLSAKEWLIMTRSKQQSSTTSTTSTHG
jgi:hypothetical protein